jgi:hypothetical protein
MGHDHSQTASSDTTTLAQRQDSAGSPEERAWREYEQKGDELDRVAPPIEFGPRGAFYQYSVGVPQFHLVLVSVLQGIVFGMLASAAPLPTDVQPNVALSTLSLAFAVKYLSAIAPYLVSALLVLTIWVNFVYVSAVLVWPATFGHALLIYGVTFAEVFMVRELPAAPEWLFWVGIIVGTSGIVRLHNRRYFEEHFVDENVRLWVTKNELVFALFFLGLGIISIVLSAIYDFCVDGSVCRHLLRTGMSAAGSRMASMLLLSSSL